MAAKQRPSEDTANRLVCRTCDTAFASVEDGIVVFDDAVDKENFFEKQAIARMSERYRCFDRAAFLESLKKTELSEMGEVNKAVGITRKFWWEPHIGKVEDKSIIEVGRGINYIVPYWLECGNGVVAIDACKESILLLRRVIEQAGLDRERIRFAAADARTIKLAETFDVININNMPHHMATRGRSFMATRGRSFRVCASFSAMTERCSSWNRITVPRRCKWNSTGLSSADGVMIGHSFLAGGAAPIPGEVKATASWHRAKRGFGLGFPWDWGKMTSTG